jgi:hypothetical protein
LAPKKLDKQTHGGSGISWPALGSRPSMCQCHGCRHPTCHYALFTSKKIIIFFKFFITSNFAARAWSNVLNSGLSLLAAVSLKS